MPKPNQHPQKEGKGGKGGGRGHLSREVTVSKALSYLLRHAAEREGLKIDSQGYANVADVLSWRKLKSLKVTFAEIVEAVETSDKKRFALLYLPSAQAEQPQQQQQDTENQPDPNPIPNPNPDDTDNTNTNTNEATNATSTALTASKTDPDPTHYLIRATQGHSIKSVEAEALLQKLTLDDGPSLPETVVHGTYHSAWPQILASGGLRCMGRNHAHFATGPSLDSVLRTLSSSSSASTSTSGEKGAGSGKEKSTVISGMRHDAQVLIYIDIRKALETGCPFWRSENGVILSEGMEGPGKKEGERVIPVEVFDVVVERKLGLGKIWEGGVSVQELPEEVTRRGGPKGKRR